MRPRGVWARGEDVGVGEIFEIGLWLSAKGSSGLSRTNWPAQRGQLIGCS